MLPLTTPGRDVHVKLILCNSTPCMPRARWQLIVLLDQALLQRSLSLVSWGRYHITVHSLLILLLGVQMYNSKFPILGNDQRSGH